MNKSYRSKIIKMGDSYVIQVPKPLLDTAGLVNEIEIVCKDNVLIISALKPPRKGWDASFKTMSRQGDDLLPDESFVNDWDRTEWVW